MDATKRDDIHIPMISTMDVQSDDHSSSASMVFSIRTGNASMPIPKSSPDHSEIEHNLTGFTSSPNLHVNRNNEFIFQPRSPSQGALRQRTNDPKTERCPSMDLTENAKFHNMVYEDQGWTKTICSFIPGVMNPHAKIVQQWNMFVMISCLCAVFLDPLFLFLLSVHQDNKCIERNWPMTKTIIVLRSLTDLIYLLHMLLQFRMPYVDPRSRVLGRGELVDDPKLIARNYLCGYFIMDFFVVLPLPQMIILFILPHSIGDSSPNHAKSLLQVVILVQYVPRLFTFLPLTTGYSPTGFIFESAWAIFFSNLLTFVLASHVVGSCWYFFGVQRVNRCFREACGKSNITKGTCMDFIDCAQQWDNNNNNASAWELWKNNENAASCFGQGDFDFGIYRTVVNLTTHKSTTRRYTYSFFWGLQQISTLAGNQVPSYFEWEVLFTMAIIGIGLLLFAKLIGNMQNFLQNRGKRRLEMSLRRQEVEREVEEWMHHRHLPEELRRQVKNSEKFNWYASRGVNEEQLMERFPEDLQRDIRRHLFGFMKRVRIFQLLDEPILDAIYERIRTKKYINGSKILFNGRGVDKMVFIIRGVMESVGEDWVSIHLSEGDVCGEELLTWNLDVHSSANKDRKRGISGYGLLSNRTVICLTNVEAFVLLDSDLEEVTSRFARFFKSPRVQGAIRYESPYWRGVAARRIQVAWRYRQKRRSSANSSHS